MNVREWALYLLRREIQAASVNPQTSEEVRCCDCDFTTTVYSDEVRAFYRFHCCWPPPERQILTDLITELRTTPRSPSARPPLWVRLSVDRAEARLREVQGERPNMP